MRAAFIVMSILGCDDAGTSCTAIAQVPQQWQTIADCDAASEKHLAGYTNVNYPMVVAVCQTAGTTALSDSTDDADEVDTASRAIGPVAPASESHRLGIAARAVQLVRDALPSTKGLKDTVIYPVHVVNDTYSWVARKISK
jgi:hypothetical protein